MSLDDFLSELGIAPGSSKSASTTAAGSAAAAPGVRPPPPAAATSHEGASEDFLDWLQAPAPATHPPGPAMTAASAPLPAPPPPPQPEGVTSKASNDLDFSFSEEALTEPDNWLEKMPMPAPPAVAVSDADFYDAFNEQPAPAGEVPSADMFQTPVVTEARRYQPAAAFEETPAAPAVEQPEPPAAAPATTALPPLHVGEQLSPTAAASSSFGQTSDLHPPQFSRRYSFNEHEMQLGSPRASTLSIISGDDAGVDRLVKQFSSTFNDSDISVKPNEFILSTPPPSANSPERPPPPISPQPLDRMSPSPPTAVHASEAPSEAAVHLVAEAASVVAAAPPLEVQGLPINRAESTESLGSSFISASPPPPQPIVVNEGTKRVVRRFASAFDDINDDDGDQPSEEHTAASAESKTEVAATSGEGEDFGFSGPPPDRQATPGSESGFGFSSEILPVASEFVFNAPVVNPDEATAATPSASETSEHASGLHPPPIAERTETPESDFQFSEPPVTAPSEFTFDAPVESSSAPAAVREQTPESEGDFGFGFKASSPVPQPSAVVVVEDDFGFGTPVAAASASQEPPSPIPVTPAAAAGHQLHEAEEEFGFSGSSMTETTRHPAPLFVTPKVEAQGLQQDEGFGFGAAAQPQSMSRQDDEHFGFGFSTPAAPALGEPLAAVQNRQAAPAVEEEDFGFPSSAAPLPSEPVEEDFGFAPVQAATARSSSFGKAASPQPTRAFDEGAAEDFGFGPPPPAVSSHPAQQRHPQQQPEPNEEEDFGFPSQPQAEPELDFGFGLPAFAQVPPEDDFDFAPVAEPAAVPAAIPTQSPPIHTISMSAFVSTAAQEQPGAVPKAAAPHAPQYSPSNSGGGAGGPDDDDFAVEFGSRPGENSVEGSSGAVESPIAMTRPSMDEVEVRPELDDSIAAARMASAAITAEAPGEIAEAEEQVREPSERWKAWSKALGIDHNSSPPIMTLEHRDQECAQVVRSQAPSAAEAIRALAQLENVWGELGGRGFTRRVTQRTAALLEALVSYMDPELFLYLQSADPSWAMHPGLHGMYGGSDPVLALWDAAIVYGMPGFEAPAQGALFFALGLLVCNRDTLMMGHVDQTLAQLGLAVRAGASVSKYCQVGSRASNKVPPSFRVIITQPELDLGLLNGMVVYEIVAAPPPPQPHPPPAESASTTPAAPKSLFSSLRTLAAKTASTLQVELEARIAGAKTDVKTVERLYVVGFASHLDMGFELSSNVSGLCVGAIITATEGSLIESGDAVHTVNGASVHLLSPQVAKAIIAQQTSPLLITFSTVHVDKLATRKLCFARRIKQFKLLHPRLAAFYGRHGPSKVDKVQDILDLYAGFEEGLLQGLGDKYGERVPGDASLKLGMCASTAEEVLQFITRQTKGACLVDVRAPDEIDAMGRLAGMLPSDNETGLLKALGELEGKPRIFLVASGKHRVMSCADPQGAAAAEGAETARLLHVASLLHRNRFEYVAMVQGGLCEIIREMRCRGMEPELHDVGGGWLHWAADAYSRLDFEDSHSVARYLTAFVHGFEQRRASKEDALSAESKDEARPRKRSLEAVMEKAATVLEKPKSVLSKVGSAGSSKWASWGVGSTGSFRSSSAAASTARSTGNDLGLEEEEDDDELEEEEGFKR